MTAEDAANLGDYKTGDLVHLVNCSIKTRSTKFGVILYPPNEWFLYINSNFNANYYGLELYRDKYSFLNQEIHYIACRNVAFYNMGNSNRISRKYDTLDIEDLNRLSSHINGLRHFDKIQKEKISLSIKERIKYLYSSSTHIH